MHFNLKENIYVDGCDCTKHIQAQKSQKEELNFFQIPSKKNYF